MSVVPARDNEFAEAIALCREIFCKKLGDYGASWRMLRATSLTDQLFIKAKRIRTIEVTGQACIPEGSLTEFMGLINYGIIGLIQLDKGFADRIDMSNDEAIEAYDHWSEQCTELMRRKNHDYGAAWEDMRVSSYTDFILTKIERVKEIEDNGGHSAESEGIDANYMDIINYAVFAVIKLAVRRGATPDEG